VDFALVVLRILVLCILGFGTRKSDAREEHHHGDEEDGESHFDRFGDTGKTSGRMN